MILARITHYILLYPLFIFNLKQFPRFFLSLILLRILKISFNFNVFNYFLTIRVQLKSFVTNIISVGLPWWLSIKESTCQCRRSRFNPWVGKIPWRNKWLLIPVFLPGESYGQRSLVGYSRWGHKSRT